MAEPASLDLYEVDQRFELLVNSVVDYALYMLDTDGRIATWNAGARRFKGYEAEEIIGQHFSRFFTEEDRSSGLPARALRIAAEEGKFETEGWRVRKDGTRFWASVVIDPVRNTDGKLVGFAKITRDITAKRDAEQALFETEQKFRMLVQGVRDYAIYMLDENGLITNWNTGAATIKGYSADEIVGQHFSRFYTPEDRARGEPQRALETALKHGKYENEAWRVRKDGTRFWASVLIDPIYDDDGRFVGFAKVTRDMTDRRLAQQALEEARAALAQSQKLQALGELTGGIAHDFNNLMTVIRGSADLLRRGGLSEEKSARYLDAIIETSERAATLTSHLLAFSRRQALKPQVMDVNIRLDAIGEVLSRTLDSHIEVVLDLDPDLWPAEVDPAELETALLNAAFNARDAMPQGGRLTLSTANSPSDEGDSICITVADTGEGMNEEVLSRVFEPFFTTKPVGKGTGLGLSQIHGFAAQSGGRAEISSRLGEGTAVRIILPRSGKAPATARLGDASPRLQSGLKVLLVEDNAHVLAFAEQLLGELECRVTAVDSAERALSLVEQNRDYDLLFSDVVMPGMSGVELALAVRKKMADLPVVLATGYSDEVIDGAGAQFEILRKPYDSQSLGSAMLAALERVDQAPAAARQ
ncbi:PAS domain-containing sensor histidine kinase [Sphingosinicella sp. CPCC 101087]|uniref:hybrid sensor histidine kinase/response regulator n=1 Tax=Sphingosinicella sp. CPCC 101087 TaxID=2497754 RepID=UPI00101CE788|nr:PAS domain-containing sensor histidine kinase [Sphingosinicella sp. CPCC 101087]